MLVPRDLSGDGLVEFMLRCKQLPRDCKDKSTLMCPSLQLFFADPLGYSFTATQSFNGV